MAYDIFHCPSCVNTWKQSNCVVSKPLEQAAGISAVGVATSSLRSGINQAEGWGDLLSSTYKGFKSRLFSAGAAISTYAATIGLTAYYTVAGWRRAPISTHNEGAPGPSLLGTGENWGT